MKNKKLDVVGILCGLFLVVALVANIVLGNINAEANRPKIPDTAQTYETTARGIFSDVKVETVADADGIYSVKVVEHGETPELGGVAADELPAKIVEAQSVEIDGVAGATMTSNAIKAAVTEALVQAGFLEAPAEEPVEETPAEEPAAEAPVEEAAEESAAAAEGAQTVTVTKPGVFGEDVVVEVVADADEIYSVTVVENNETQGIGSMAVDQLPAKIVEAQSAEIDGVAGATMTSNAIKAAVTEALEQIGFGTAVAAEAPAEEAAEEPAAAAEGAQTVTVTKPGVFGEDVVVEVVADAGEIYSVTVVENNETMGIGSMAVDQLPAKIVEAQSAEIDGVAGATMTSNAIKAAVTEALEQIGFGTAVAAEAPAEEPVEEATAEGAAAEETAAAAPEGAQTVTVTKPGVFGEDVVVEVVADAGEIYSVTVVENNETMGIGSMAVDQLPAKIVEAQSTEIDGIAGATMTSNAIKAAVTEALEQIGFGAAEEGAQTVTVTKPGVFGEDVVVEVVADAGEIYSVTVVKNNETMGIGSMAVDQLPAKIVEAQGAEIDGVAGATMTSNAIKAAVAEALEQIGFGAAEEGAQTVTVTKPGVFGEDVVVEVVADADEIYSVTVLENNETMGIGSMAVDQLPAKIVEAQSAEIDGVAGATMTSNAIKAAVAEALEQIGFGA